VPAWPILIAFGVVVVLVNSLMMWFALWRWPEAQIIQKPQSALISPRGATTHRDFGEQLQTPDGPSRREMSAIAFMNAPTPSPMIDVISGEERYWKAWDEFEAAQDEWLLHAPAEVLNDLIGAAEPLMAAFPDIGDPVHLLFRAEELRGTLDRSALEELASRSGNKIFRATLDGVDYDPYARDPIETE
jgi:hypothetical protein